MNLQEIITQIDTEAGRFFPLPVPTKDEEWRRDWYSAYLLTGFVLPLLKVWRGELRARLAAQKTLEAESGELRARLAAQKTPEAKAAAEGRERLCALLRATSQELRDVLGEEETVC